MPKNPSELPEEYRNLVPGDSYKPNLPDLPFPEWKDFHVTDDNVPKRLVFNDDVTDWTFEHSLFADRGDTSIMKPVRPRKYSYKHREKLSYEVTSILDDWWVQVKDKKLLDDELAFRHNPQPNCWCRVQVFRDLLDSSSPISSEVYIFVSKFQNLSLQLSVVIFSDFHI